MKSVGDVAHNVDQATEEHRDFRRRFGLELLSTWKEDVLGQISLGKLGEVSELSRVCSGVALRRVVWKDRRSLRSLRVDGPERKKYLLEARRVLPMEPSVDLVDPCSGFVGWKTSVDSP